jgi:hypothetical protein
VPQYAERTTVSVERSRNEIEQILARYGAQQFMYGWTTEGAIVAFVVSVPSGQHRQVRFELPLPSRDERRFTHHSRGRRTAIAAEKEWEQASRQRWRALALVIKAKLEAIASGIATFEDEFLAYTMLPSGETVGSWLAPQMEAAYDPDRGIMPAGLRLALEAGDRDEG